MSEDDITHADVIYMTRIQKERFDSLDAYEALAGIYIFSREKASAMHRDALLMHPLPRVYEIPCDVDVLPQAHYFEQAKNGLPVRMALIDWCLTS